MRREEEAITVNPDGSSFTNDNAALQGSDVTVAAVERPVEGANDVNSITISDHPSGFVDGGATVGVSAIEESRSQQEKEQSHDVCYQVYLNTPSRSTTIDYRKIFWEKKILYLSRIF